MIEPLDVPMVRAAPVEILPGFNIIQTEGDRPGAFAVFPYDRELVRRFREAFPRARWRGDEGCWFVPGTTAVRRLDAWISRELSALDWHADEKGRDAFAFDPLESPYLVVGDDLSVRTPYSRTVVETMRMIPWAHWDPDHRMWRVPFRSYDELRHHWPVIEEAARRNEPEARRRRQEERRRQGTPQGTHGGADLLASERRRRRFPVPADDPPPLEQPVATTAFGVIVFDAIGTEPVDPRELEGTYAHLREAKAPFVWGCWRMPTPREVLWARGTRHVASPELKATRGWWLPEQAELRERLRRLRELERAQETRSLRHPPT